MHHNTTLPNHLLETAIPVLTREFDFKSGKYREVKKKVQIQEWFPGKENNLEDILRRNRSKIAKKLKAGTVISPKNGTVNGIPMRIHHMDYPQGLRHLPRDRMPPLPQMVEVCETKRQEGAHHLLLLPRR